MKTKMNKMWKTFAVVLLITTSACGQQRGGQGGRDQQGPPPVPTTSQIKKMVSDLTKELSLSEDQETKILELYKTHFKKVESKTKSGRPKREEMEALKADFEKSVKSILNKKQQKLFTAFQKKNSKNRPPRK